MSFSTNRVELGLWSSELRQPGGALGEVAAELDELGWGTVWLPGVGRTGIWRDAERLLASAPHLRVALGVMNIWGPDAEAAAAEHRRLAAAYGARLITGIGVGSPQSAAAGGGAYTTPLAVMNDYLDRQDRDPAGIPVGERVLGALGPRMTELAARRSAGVHSFLVTPEGTARTRALLGPGKLLAPYLPVSLAPDRVTSRHQVREAVGMFVGFPSYQANLRRLGFDDADLRPGGSDRLIDAVSAQGSLAAVAERIDAYREAGADHIALHVLGSGPGLPREEWRELSALLTR